MFRVHGGLHHGQLRGGDDLGVRNDPVAGDDGAAEQAELELVPGAGSERAPGGGPVAEGG